MADNELLIKINADAKNAKKAFEEIRSKTEDLEGSLKTVALVSGAAFAALTAEIHFSVKAFEDAQQSSKELTLALQNQGIYTTALREKYDQLAKSVSAKTGIDDDAITKAQAVAQTYLHQTEITGALTQAIADLSVSMGGDLNGAAEKIARSIGSSTNAFHRQGLVLAEGLTTAERYGKVLEFVQLRAGGMAEEFNKSNGYALSLSTAFNNLQEKIGEKFFPIISAARKGLAEFFQTLSENPKFVSFTAAIIAGGAALALITTGLAALAPVIITATGLAAAFGVTLGAALGPITLIALGITGLAAAFGYLATKTHHATEEVDDMKGRVDEARTLVDRLQKTANSKVKSVFSEQAKTDLIEAQAHLVDLEEKYRKIQSIQNNKAKSGEVQDPDKKSAADSAAALERAKQQRIVEIAAGGIALIKLQNENASADLITLKTKELETLKALNDAKSNDERNALTARLAIVRGLQTQAQDEELDRRKAFDAAIQEADDEQDSRKITTVADLSEAKLAELRATVKTEADIDRDAQEEILKSQIDANNKYLLEKKKFGVAFATINKLINSDEVQGVKSASNELVQLQQSKNATLKAIGKVAAVAQITIATSESAMNIYRGFSTIPIIGPALGIAGAAAAVAFGAERIGSVVGAADGGLITGGIPGRDSVPALLMPGELVVPQKNFEQVVGAVRGENGGAGNAQVVDILSRMEAKLSTPNTTIIQGDVHTDDAFVDAFIRKINDAVEFRNAKLSTG